MVRTSRNGAPAASVDALDNLNLDDMFADEGDALFDGLDMDLGNMDDIADGSTAAVTTLSPGSNSRTASAAGGSGGAPPIHAPVAPSLKDEDEEQHSATGRRRTTKRKIKSPMFYEDDDDDYVEEPAKKKKRTKAASSIAAVVTKAPLPSKRKGSGSAKGPTAVAAASLSPTSKAKTQGPRGRSKAQRSASMPPPPGRPAAVGSAAAATAAAAGSFGGRGPKKASAGGGSLSIQPGSRKASAAAGARPGPASPAASASSAGSSASDLFRGSLQGRSQSATAASLARRSGTSIQHQASANPGLNQGGFCGLLPSNTLFYPFMPQLPPEPSFKHRKVFAMIDRIHTSFMSHVTSPTNPIAANAPGAGGGGLSATTVQETEPIFQLMQEAFREEKPSGNDAALQERHRSIGNAITALRRNIGLFEKGRLAGDLLNVGALLKRQHDFLVQNLANMERWCKNHLPESEYAIVYPPQRSARGAGEAAVAMLSRPGEGLYSLGRTAPPLSLLSTIKTPEIKVKILCSNFKEPRVGPLLAVLPFLRLATALPGLAAASPLALLGEPKQAQAKGKKRKTLASPLANARTPFAASAAAPTHPPVPKPTPTYLEMRPGKRRKCLSELISRTAQQLESKYLLSVDDQRSLVERQQGEMRQIVEDDPVPTIHTLGMWRWLEKSGLFSRITDGDVRWRLDSTSSSTSSLPPPVDLGVLAVTPWLGRRESSTAMHSGERSRDEVVDRLQSLLVSEEEGDERSTVDDHVDVEDLYEDEKPGFSQQSTRSSFFRELDDLGLRPDAIPPPLDVKADRERFFEEQALVGSRATTPLEPGDPGDELGDVIHSMIDDLQQLNGVNSQRTTFLESVATLYLQNEASGRKAEDASLIARYQQLLRKSKEAKGKNGKLKAAKKDEYSLPW